MSTVNVITHMFYREEVKDNVWYRFSRQMYNWKLSHVNSLLNLWGMAIQKHTVFREARDKTMWSKKSIKSTEFLEIHLCENKKNRILVRITSVFSTVFVWATTRRRAMEKTWHVQESPQKWGCRMLPTTNMTQIKTDDSWLKTNFPDMCGSKHTLGISNCPERITHLQFLRK